MDLSIVVPTLKSPAEIPVIERLERCEYQDYEVIIRDDSSVTRARNQGYRRAQAEKIVFLDDDSLPRNGYLREASRTLEREAAVAGRTVHPRDDLFAGQLTDHYDFGDDPCYVDRFWGCNMGIRKDVLDDVGGWDESMGWGHEEKELADRVVENYDIYYNPEMIVDHVYAESLFDFWRKQYRLEQGTPAYLRKRGYSRRDVLVRIVVDLFRPGAYLGRTLPLTLARAGGNLARAGGRIAGLFDEYQSGSRSGSGRVTTSRDN